ncbi:MAG: hypothetical protein PHT57_11030 [Rhodoferax sp.]|nr:hypothetical protein [Rhodoferax sp.]
MSHMQAITAGLGGETLSHTGTGTDAVSPGRSAVATAGLIRSWFN